MCRDPVVSYSHDRIGDVTAVAEPELAKVAWRTWVRLGCPADVAGMGRLLDVVLPEYERRKEDMA